MVGPVRFDVHTSFLEVEDSFSVNDQYPGFVNPRNYRDIFLEVASRQRVGESLIALFRREFVSVDCFLCSDYPLYGKVYVAKIDKGLEENLRKIGRDFIKEL